VLVQLTDLHVHSGVGDAAAASRVERAISLVRMLDPAPVAVLLTGDMVNSGSAADYSRLAELLAGLDGFRVLPMMGNHDDRDLLRATFAHVPEVAGLGELRHIQYEARAGTFRILALDTQHAGHPGGKLCTTRREWLQSTLEADPVQRTIIAMHHPPMEIGVPALDDIGLRSDHRDALEVLVQDAPGVEQIICGHVHRPVTGRLAHAPIFSCPSVFYPAAPTMRRGDPIALVEGPVGIGVHAHTDSGGLASHVRVIGDVPGVLTPVAPVE